MSCSNMFRFSNPTKGDERYSCRDITAGLVSTADWRMSAGFGRYGPIATSGRSSDETRRQLLELEWVGSRDPLAA